MIEERIVIEITVEELKSNLNKYIELSKTEDVYVSENRIIITVLTNPKIKAFNDLKDLRENINIEKDINIEKVLEEEIMKKCCN